MELVFKFGQANATVDCQSVDGEQSMTLNLPNELLAGSGTEVWQLEGIGGFEDADDLRLWRAERALCGMAVVPVTAQTLQAQTYRLYQQMLQVSDGWVIHRFWNFVPHINQLKHDDEALDQYMCFCAGRAAALADHAEPLSAETLPPASAVGVPGDSLCVVFIAGVDEISPVENPLQIPAYKYPRRYGPSAPSFARAGVLQRQDAIMISGTASIRHSESLHAGDFSAQTQTAVENLMSVSAAGGHAHALTLARDSYRRSLRIYIKNPAQWSAHGALVKQSVLQGECDFNVLQADICRPELLLEVEAYAVRERVAEG